MKKSLVLICVLMLFGCTYGQEYLERSDTFIRDPHFTKYKQNRDSLESSYLQKEITYAEYIEQRDKMDEQYSKEVQERTSVIMSPDQTF